KTQYAVRAGRWPEKEDELVLVLSENNNVSDRVLYSLGIKDAKELEKAIKAYSSGKKIKISKKKHSFNFKDFIGMEFKLVDSYKCYKYDKKYKVWASKKDNSKYMKKLVAKSRPIKIVGVVSAKKDASAKMLMAGIYYTSDLVNGVIDRAASSEVVKDQLKRKKINVFTGKKFDDVGKKGGVDFTKLFSVNSDAMKKIFAFDMNSLDFNSMGFDANSVGDIFKNAGKNTSQKELEKLFADLMKGYQSYAKKHNKDTFDDLSSGFEKYMSSPEAAKIIQGEMASIIKKSGASIDGQAMIKILTKVMSGFQSYINKKGYKDVTKISTYLNEYLGSQEAQALLAEAMQEYMPKIDPASMDFNKLVTKLMNGYNQYAKKHKLATMNSVMRGFRKYLSSNEASKKINKIVSSMVDTKAIQNSMAASMAGFSNSLKDVFKFDPSALASAFKMKSSKKELEDLMSSLMSKEITTYEQNMKNLGYANKSEPFEIKLYPKSFESKDKLGGLIKDYNRKMKASGQKRKTIAYTDIVGTLMSSVTKIVNALSYILIAFVGISLVVSSIMIGVITYISVLERKKEIGVLRAIGASKRNVSNVFNAETFIVGALAGVLGIIITNILLIPMNMIIRYLGDGIDMTAYLPFDSALILILISIVLTLLGGLIPAKKAARQDPVIALRSE
ncbi:MAG: ABC transporter permease, partial [Eubacterium sp.]|nr:ABC transporter permease [Eubacterium sp.]